MKQQKQSKGKKANRIQRTFRPPHLLIIRSLGSGCLSSVAGNPSNFSSIGMRIALFEGLFYDAGVKTLKRKVSLLRRLMPMIFKKRTVVFLAALIIVPLLFSQTDDLFKIEASISPARLSRGQEGKVILRFTVQEGLTINPLPSFTVEISPSDELVFSKNFFSSSDLEIEILEEDGKEYLDLSKQIEILFTVRGEAERGIHNLQGKIKYFAVSKKENWCLKTTSNFSASFYVRVSLER